jgi:hypothetical protein
VFNASLVIRSATSWWMCPASRGRREVRPTQRCVPDDCNIVGFGTAHQLETEHTVEGQSMVGTRMPM